MAAPPQAAPKPAAVAEPPPSKLIVEPPRSSPLPPPLDPIKQTDTPVADPLRPRENMKPEEALKASPNHLLEPDPLPKLNRPIFEPPHITALHLPTLHTRRVTPHVEAAVEELRMRLGEVREFLKRFPHDIGGDLGDLVDHLRTALGVARPDPERDAFRQAEDQSVREKRRAEDLSGPPSREKLGRRAEEDAGLAALRRVQDTSP